MDTVPECSWTGDRAVGILRFLQPPSQAVSQNTFAHSLWTQLSDAPMTLIPLQVLLSQSMGARNGRAQREAGQV